jgi:hypothetical protein
MSRWAGRKRCGREKPRLAAATSERGLIANGTAKVFGVLQRSRAKRAEAKNHKVFGGPHW